jgi:hypothetical protein
MPSTPRLALPYPASTDPADGPAAFQALALGVEAVTPVPSTTLPATPYDGQLANLTVDTVLGVSWQLRYNAASASTFKWEFVGGPPWLASQTNLSGPGVNGWGDGNVPNTGPALVVPRAGDYYVSCSAMAGHSPVTTVPLGVGIGAVVGANTPAISASAYGWLPDAPSAGSTTYTVTLVVANCRMNSLGAGADLRMRYYGDANYTKATYDERRLALVPIRVT